jgi:hypothetical protein
MQGDFWGDFSERVSWCMKYSMCCTGLYGIWTVVTHNGWVLGMAQWCQCQQAKNSKIFTVHKRLKPLQNQLKPNAVILIVVPRIINTLQQPNEIMAVSTTINILLGPNAIMAVNKLQQKPNTTYLLKAITSSLSFIRHLNDWGKSPSKFFCKSRYCKFSHRPMSRGSWDNALQLRFRSVMRCASFFNLKYSEKQCSVFCGVLNTLVKTKWYIATITTWSSKYYTTFLYVHTKTSWEKCITFI